jgi:hypothetical protein
VSNKFVLMHDVLVLGGEMAVYVVDTEACVYVRKCEAFNGVAIGIIYSRLGKSRRQLAVLNNSF